MSPNTQTNHRTGGDNLPLPEVADDYLAAIAPARTFGFEREIPILRQAGLTRGGSLENAIVLSDNGLLNPEGLRFNDEFVRHKILDIIGDLALVGYPILGKVTAVKSGHALHAQLVTQLVKEVKAWELVESNNAY
jgi:UDP-3-O-[3-hydroxymyristoyl] N-acetylglucosamine deacetylase